MRKARVVSGCGVCFGMHLKWPKFDIHVRSLAHSSWKLCQEYTFGHSPSAADSAADVSYWQKNVHNILANKMGGVTRNRMTD